MKFTKLLLTGLLVIVIVSCDRGETRSITPGLIEQNGYILTSEQIDNGYFNNKLFYFFPVDKIEPKFQVVQFLKSKNTVGYGFSLYSSYYVRLINCMGIDLISYAIDEADTDPFRLKIEYWKILPVKLIMEHNSSLKNTSEIFSDSLLLRDGSYHKFRYSYIGRASIKSMEILLPKNDDLTGNEAKLLIRKDGIFGKD